MFKVSALIRLDTRAQTGAPLSDCRINNTLVKFTVTSRWERRYAVKAVHMVDNSGSTSRSIISCLGPEIFVQINRILTKFCSWKLGVPVTMTHRVHATGNATSFGGFGFWDFAGISSGSMSEILFVFKCLSKPIYFYSTLLHRVLTKRPTYMACYNFDTYKQILIFWEKY